MYVLGNELGDVNVDAATLATDVVCALCVPVMCVCACGCDAQTDKYPNQLYNRI